MLTRKLLRTAWKYKAQFLSMILMVAIGVGIFVGFNIEWYSLAQDTFGYMEDTGFADYRVFAEEGFSKEDLEKINDIEGVDNATRYLTVNVDVKDDSDKTKALGMTVVDNFGEDSTHFYLVEGKEYDEEESGIWLNDKYAQENNLHIGDEICVTYASQEYTFEIVGLVKSSEYLICVLDENQLMPDFASYGYFFMTPKAFKDMAGYNFYPQINILSDLEKEEMEELVDDAMGRTMLMLSKEENISYAEAEGEMNEGKTMAEVLPELFLAIAILTMITTMNRLTANEKVQIGTLKALGFKDRRILWHYTSYGAFIGTVGIALGILLGYGVGGFVISPTGMMATYIDMPSWELSMPLFVWPVLAVILALLTLISFLSVKQMLAGTAAEALRPLAPKKVRETWIERTRFWERRSFGTKWNFRDVVRHKSRSAMTLLGVAGCTILITGSFGMRDTMDAFMKMMYQDICNYETKINLVEGITKQQAEELAQNYEGDLAAVSSVKVNGEAISFEIYRVEYENYRFVDYDCNLLELGDDGVYVCTRLQDSYAVGDTITFSPYGSSTEYEAKVAGYTRSMMTENIVLTEKYAKEIGVDYTFNTIYTDTAKEDIASDELISGTQSKSAVIDALEVFTTLMDEMVIILIVAALLLGGVVLYNLGVMSYTERYREMATLKVVGFKDRQISKLLISQNDWLTVIGIIIGIPLGVWTVKLLMDKLAGEYEMLAKIYPSSYLLTIALTYGASLIVSFFVAKKNKKIDMVEALKGAE